MSLGLLHKPLLSACTIAVLATAFPAGVAAQIGDTRLQARDRASRAERSVAERGWGFERNDNDFARASADDTRQDYDVFRTGTPSERRELVRSRSRPGRSSPASRSRALRGPTGALRCFVSRSPMGSSSPCPGMVETTFTTASRSRCSSEQFQNYTYGGQGDLWGRVWSRSEFRNQDFVVRVRYNRTMPCLNRAALPRPSPGQGALRGLRGRRQLRRRQRLHHRRLQRPHRDLHHRQQHLGLRRRTVLHGRRRLLEWCVHGPSAAELQ